MDGPKNARNTAREKTFAQSSLDVPGFHVFLQIGVWGIMGHIGSPTKGKKVNRATIAIGKQQLD